ncbi:MAG: ATP-binding protein [Bdellovibrionales bacterium]
MSHNESENEKTYHRLLKRQLRKSRNDNGEMDYDALLEAVNAVYNDYDIERDRQQRALTLMSDEMAEKNRAAERANNAKSEFLANMSHELRTPLNSIIGMVVILLTDQGIQGEYREMLEVVRKSGDNLLSLVNDVLDLSKIEAKQLTLEHIPFEATDIVQRVILAMEPLADEKDLDFSTSVCDRTAALSALIGDPLRLTRILINLIGNAIKYTKDGWVTLDVSSSADGDNAVYLKMSVRDSGIGIPPDKLESIFDEFSQVDTSTTRKYGGTGLGLSITRQLVELMSGEIGVESEENTGSHFWVCISFPIATQSDIDKHAQEESPVTDYDVSGQRVPLDNVRILVAEDHAMNQLYIKKLFKNIGVQHYEISEDGAHAFDRYKSCDFDMVLMDCHMPKMNGYEATGAIRDYEKDANKPHIPIIAMTANAMKGDREKCLESGMDDYISKPVDMKRLKAVMGRWIEFPE